MGKMRKSIIGWRESIIFKYSIHPRVSKEVSSTFEHFHKINQNPKLSRRKKPSSKAPRTFYRYQIYI